MRTYYAHPVDVLRKYNPQLAMSDLETDSLIGHEDLEKVLARIEGVESEFESLTRNPFREVRVGTPDQPRSWEHQEAELYRTEYGAKIWLDNMNITPLDPAKGDELHIRKGKDSWDHITPEEGDRWEADYEKGWIRIFSRYRRSVHRSQLRDKFLRITYRHGAAGDKINDAGQTELTAAAASGDTVLQVEDAGAVPRTGILFVGGDEYVSLTGRDHGADELTVSRGVRATQAGPHDAGTTVHYCPLVIREAVAGRAAQELLRYEDWVDDLVESGGYPAKEKMSDWQDEWESVLNKFSGVRSI